jgi:Glycosyl hydrolases family 28
MNNTGDFLNRDSLSWTAAASAARRRFACPAKALSPLRSASAIQGSSGLRGTATALLAASLFVFAFSSAAKTLNILDFGAKGDGATPDTAAIQRTIDAAGDGDQVLIPKHRTFLTATLNLKSGIDFHLAGTLLISTNQSDYSGDGVILASNAVNLTLSGSGEILGRSLAFMTNYDTPNEWWLFQEWRPKMFVLTGCTNLVVRNLTFADAPFWGLHMLGCENVLVDNVTVDNRLDVPNDDGIDPDHCRHVEIKNCHITCGDDAIVLKSTRQTNDFGDCAHIWVHDCVIRTQDAGLKIGTETVGAIYDVLFEHCKILSSSRGLCIQLRDEGEISKILFRDIDFVSRYHSEPWWGRGEAISFTAFPRTAQTRQGTLHDVRVENVSGVAENSIRLNGTADSHITGVVLKNISVKIARWTKYPGGVYDNRPTKVLPPVEPHAADGINLRYADGVSLEDCAVKWGREAAGGFGGAIVAEHVTGLNLSGFRGDDREHSIVIR